MLNGKLSQLVKLIPTYFVMRVGTNITGLGGIGFSVNAQNRFHADSKSF